LAQLIECHFVANDIALFLPVLGHIRGTGKLSGRVSMTWNCRAVTGEVDEGGQWMAVTFRVVVIQKYPVVKRLYIPGMSSLAASYLAFADGKTLWYLVKKVNGIPFPRFFPIRC